MNHPAIYWGGIEFLFASNGPAFDNLDLFADGLSMPIHFIETVTITVSIISVIIYVTAEFAAIDIPPSQKAN